MITRPFNSRMSSGPRLLVVAQGGHTPLPVWLCEMAHATKVVTPGCGWLIVHTRRKALDQWICLSRDFKSDLYWWHLFLHQWNGVSLLTAHVHHPPNVTLFTNVSGNRSCGGTTGQEWFQSPCSPQWAAVNILLPRS